MTRSLLSQLRQYCFYDIEWTEIVDFELIADEVQGLLRSGKLFYCANKSYRS